MGFGFIAVSCCSTDLTCTTRARGYTRTASLSVVSAAHLAQLAGDEPAYELNDRKQLIMHLSQQHLLSCFNMHPGRTQQQRNCTAEHAAVLHTCHYYSTAGSLYSNHGHRKCFHNLSMPAV